MTMTRRKITALGLAAALVPGLGVGHAQEGEHGHDKHGEKKAGAEAGEVRVILLDKEKKPLSIEGMSATLFLEMAGGTKRTVKVEAAAGEAGHGQTLPMGDRFVVLEVKKPHGGHGEEGHGEGHGGEHGEDGHVGHGGKAAFFRGEVPLEAYACPMGCAMTEKAGKCPKCGMDMKECPIAFDAVVVLKGKDGKSQNVKGFKYPSGEAPRTLADAIAKVEAVAAAVEAKINEGKLAEVHEAAEPLKLVGDALPGLAGGSREKAEAIGSKLKVHFDELDEAGDAGDEGKTKAALARLRETLAEMRKLGQ
jgi:hypothetical protein